jgi:glutaredoxin 3
MSVKIYSTPTCPWCHKAKEWMKQNKVKYTEKNVADDAKARDEMIEKSGQMGVPVLDINGQILVGFDPNAMKKALKKK